MKTEGRKLNKPFLLKPSGKDYLWGGNRLNDDFTKDLNMVPLAETWECSTHPNGPSYIASGQFEGRTLREVIQSHPEYLGLHSESKGDLPVLVKLIDAYDDLSVQVHPDDEYANANENGQSGKTEMWYVLDASDDAHIIYGLNTSVSKKTMREALDTDSVEKLLKRIPIEKDDIFIIPAGTIHSICKGALIAEIQENSDLTYRLYDYNRIDKDGNRRELQIDKALDVANLAALETPKQPLRLLKYRPGVASELLARCKYFEVHRMIVNTELKQKVAYQSDEMSFRVLLCISGCGIIRFDDEILDIYKGDCVFVPASSMELLIHGQLQFLDIRG